MDSGVKTEENSKISNVNETTTTEPSSQIRQQTTTALHEVELELKQVDSEAGLLNTTSVSTNDFVMEGLVREYLARHGMTTALAHFDQECVRCIENVYIISLMMYFII